MLKRLSQLFSLPVKALAFVEGPDISKYQGDVNWQKMASKAKFVIIRAGYGNNYIDPYLEKNVTGATSVGLPYGLYWFVTPDKDAAKHANSFAAAIQTYGGTIKPTFDLETTGGLSKNDLVNWYEKLYKLFQERAELPLNAMMTYTSPGFLDRAIPLTNFIKFTDLWVAAWTSAPQPTIPQEWAKSDRTWAYWQYTSKGKGSDYGAQSINIDVDRKNEAAPPGGEMKYKVVKLVKKRKDHNTSSEILGTREVGEIVNPQATWGDVKYPGAYWAKGQDGAWSVVQYYNPTIVYMEPFV